VLTSVIIDDYLPVKSNGTPAFCKSHDQELWAMLLEKAFAKLHGNFDAMAAGKSGMALHHLTGYPSLDFMHDNMDQLMKINDTGAEGMFERMLIAD